MLVAREAAAIDLLTDGRLELGLGAGHMKSEYDEAGIPFDPGVNRVGRLAEAVSIVKGLLAGEEITFAGAHYHVTGHRIHPLPVQRPLPPILIGGSGRQLLALAACEADIVGLAGIRHREDGAEVDLSAFTHEAAATQVQWVREQAGERFDQLEFNALVQMVIVTDDPLGEAERLTARLPGLSPKQLLSTPYLLIGTVDAMVDALQERRKRLGISYIAAFEPAMQILAPVIARLAGR